MRPRSSTTAHTLWRRTNNKKVVETQPVAVAETTVIETQTTTETQVVIESAHLQIAPVAQQPSEVTQAAVEQIFVEKNLIDQPARAMEIDENYDEDDLF